MKKIVLAIYFTCILSLQSTLGNTPKNQHILNIHTYHINAYYKIQAIPIKVEKMSLNETTITIEIHYSSKINFSSLNYYENNIKQILNKSLAFLEKPQSNTPIEYKIVFLENSDLDIFQ